jgi:hypothetical protein
MKQSKSIVECQKTSSGELCVETCPLYQKCWMKEEVKEKSKNA